MPKGGWEYMMLNLNMPETHVILLKTLISSTRDGETVWEDTSEFSVHKYPFTNFPIIRSHVHPCFVVLNAWEKLRKVEEFPAHWTEDQESCARVVVNIADRWFDKEVPVGFKPDPRVTAEMRRLRVPEQARLMAE